MNNKLRDDSLIVLLVLLIIFSMFLALRLNSFNECLDDYSMLIYINKNVGIFDKIMVPFLMGIVLLAASFNAKECKLRLIYMFSILPFIVDSKVIYLINKKIVIAINTLLLFFVVLIIILYIANNYQKCR